jgi:hypothetical protein
LLALILLTTLTRLLLTAAAWLATLATTLVLLLVRPLFVRIHNFTPYVARPTRRQQIR